MSMHINFHRTIWTTGPVSFLWFSSEQVFKDIENNINDLINEWINKKAVWRSPLAILVLFMNKWQFLISPGSAESAFGIGFWVYDFML